MKTPAPASAINTATNINTITVFMGPDYPHAAAAWA
jgi:hypothetical protein